MPDSFFVTKKSRKRTRSGASKAEAKTKLVNGKGRPAKVTGARAKRRDEELDSDETDADGAGGIDELELRASDSDPGASGEEDDLETPAQKRLRLAKEYIESVKEGLVSAEGEFDAAEIDRELIASRLKQDVLEHSGKVHRFIADSIRLPPNPPFLRTKGHKQPVTAAVASSSGKLLFTSGKEGSISRWDLASGKRLSVFPKSRKGKEREEIHGHIDEVLGLALSDDGKYLASGGRDRRLIAWDAEKGEWLRSFGGHKDAIAALTFRKGTHQLYTASLDRTLKLFDLSPSVMGYVDTLFGHQDHAISVDALRAETVVSAGARDRTVRFWKVIEETQLVFRGGGKSKVREVLEGGLEELGEDEGAEKKKGEEKRFEEGSIDCVAMVDESTFISGGDSGSISVWTTGKKKPVFNQPVAHGLHEVHSETEGVVATPRWIMSLACVRYGDVIASGSWSSDIRLWKLSIDPSQKARAYSLTLIGSLPAPGIVNSLQLLLVPRSSTESFSWTKSEDVFRPPVDKEADSSSKNSSPPKESVLVVAGLGQEPRLGRWMKVKGDGAVNGSRVYSLPLHL